MERQLSNCIAIGVGTGKTEEAAAYYERVFSFERHREGGNWIEMKSGPLRLFLVGDDTATPTFDFVVGDVDATVANLLKEGCEKIEVEGGQGEQFVRDPYGQFFCISPLPEL